MSTTTLTTKGQLTLPKRVRERLALRAGDRLRVSTDRHGRVVLEPVARSRVQPLFGLLAHLAPKTPATIDEMKAAVRARATRAR